MQLSCCDLPAFEVEDAVVDGRRKSRHIIFFKRRRDTISDGGLFFGESEGLVRSQILSGSLDRRWGLGGASSSSLPTESSLERNECNPSQVVTGDLPVLRLPHSK